MLGGCVEGKRARSVRRIQKKSRDLGETCVAALLALLPCGTVAQGLAQMRAQGFRMRKMQDGIALLGRGAWIYSGIPRKCAYRAAPS